MPGNELLESDFSSKSHMKGDYEKKSSFHSSGSCSRPEGSKQRQEEEQEHLCEWEHKKNNHNGSKICHPHLPMEAESAQEEVDGKYSRKGSTRLKRGSPMSDEKNSAYDILPKVIDDQLRPCCSHTGKHLCSSMEDLSEVCDKEMEKFHLQAKVS